MRIAIFTDTFLPQVNGVVRSIVAAANELVARGHKVDVYTMCVHKLKQCAGDPAQLDARVAVRTFFSVACPFFPEVQCRVPNYIMPALALLNRRPDIIHCHTNFTIAWEARWAARRLAIPLISTHHGLLAEYLKNFGLGFAFAKKWMRRHLATSYNSSAAVTVPSEALRPELMEYGTEVPIHLVSNPIPCEMFTEYSPKNELRLKYRLTKPTIVHVGRLVPQKSVDVLLHAFANLRAAGHDAELLIIGDGRERGRLQALADALGIASAVHWTGMLQGAELTERLRASDIFASASTTETQGLVFLEAMAMGIPCVGVNAGGVPEYVRHGSSGLIVEANRPDQFAEAIARLIGEPSLCMRFGEQARRNVTAYRVGQVVDQLEVIYLAALRTFASRQELTRFSI